MNRIEFAEVLQNGENSGVEFKRDDIRPEKLAEEMAALLNFEGGYILLGVENDGAVAGQSRRVGHGGRPHSFASSDDPLLGNLGVGT
jgi:predicted HTH transcriptional regulator